jgi:spore coat protein U domain-containing protein, fimbrial subunit CupE1/2/3/6
MKMALRSIGTLALGLGVAGLALAGTVTTTLPVSATLQDTCTVSTPGVSFGTVTSTPASVSFDVTVNCSGGQTVAIALDKGQHGTATQRSMTDNAGHFQNYTLQRPGTLDAWGDNGHGGTFSGDVVTLNTGLAQTATGFARIFSLGGPAGSYSDVVNVRVDF